MFEWAYRGINASVPGDGGPECAQFLSLTRRFIETVVAVLVSAYLISWGYRNLSPIESNCYKKRDRGGKRLLLVLVSLIWGMEIGFKFASETVIYLLNPCHIITAIQIYLLAAPPSEKVTAMFRIHLYFLNGAVLAFLFPVTDTRILPFETSVYWIQHSMMMIVPYYLLRLGGVYNVEKLSDFSWCALSYGLNIAYHFGILQIFAIPSQVNLNHMLCPTAQDPFYGPYYRVCAVIHQSLLCPLTCKSYCYISDFFLTKFGPTKVKQHLNSDMVMELSENANLNVAAGDNHNVRNGRLHTD
ncbi:transmembrane protein 164 [Anabrus simplex]|uniref:transmembrane protein 164 n=1 Tax=Anabrus simplex TaxID=316456 RepID=UPI0034DD63E8